MLNEQNIELINGEQHFSVQTNMFCPIVAIRYIRA